MPRKRYRRMNLNVLPGRIHRFTQRGLKRLHSTRVSNSPRFRLQVMEIITSRRDALSKRSVRFAVLYTNRHKLRRGTKVQNMASFLLLDASDQVITLAWEREPEEGGRAIVEEVQMKTATMDSEGQQEQGDGDKGSEWKTLSSSLKSGALRKKNLEPGTAYVFRRRARKARTVGPLLAAAAAVFSLRVCVAFPARFRGFRSEMCIDRWKIRHRRVGVRGSAA